MNLIITNDDLKVINENEIRNNIIISKINNDEWYNIIISLNTKKTKKLLINIIINSIEFNTFELENNNCIEKIENIILYKDFIGLSTSFLLYNNYIDIHNYKSYFNI